MIAASPHCSVYLSPYIPYCILNFIEHQLLFYKSVLPVTTKSSDIISRCLTVSSDVFFGRKSPPLKEAYKGVDYNGRNCWY